MCIRRSFLHQLYDRPPAYSLDLLYTGSMHDRRERFARSIVPALIVAGILILGIEEWQRLPDGRLHVCVLDIGQGDSVLLISPSGKQIVIDGGPDLSALSGIGRHLSFFDRSIDLLILTHPNLDHLATLPEIVERYHVNAALLSGITFPSAQYHRLLSVLGEKRVPVLLADPSSDILFPDGLLLDVLWPPPSVYGTRPDNENDTSIVLRAIVGSSAILLTGDMEEGAEREILRTGADIRAGILKVAHHGSLTSTSTGWLLAARPETAFISVGAGNAFHHPRPAILERLESHGIQVRRTDREGELCTESL